MFSLSDGHLIKKRTSNRIYNSEESYRLFTVFVCCLVERTGSRKNVVLVINPIISLCSRN
jgi:hypothetical protein